MKEQGVARFQRFTQEEVAAATRRISTMHVHLDHHNCLEVLVFRGKASLIKSIADRLIGTKGAKHGKLSITCTGKDSSA